MIVHPTPDKPPCHNRPPFADSRTVHGIDQQTGEPVSVELGLWFEDRCATWDGVQIGPDGQPYPEAHGWLPWCRTCRWMPEGVE